VRGVGLTKGSAVLAIGYFAFSFYAYGIKVGFDMSLLDFQALRELVRTIRQFLLSPSQFDKATCVWRCIPCARACVLLLQRGVPCSAVPLSRPSGSCSCFLLCDVADVETHYDVKYLVLSFRPSNIEIVACNHV
jgi:hypothetical protein